MRNNSGGDVRSGENSFVSGLRIGALARNSGAVVAIVVELHSAV